MPVLRVRGFIRLAIAASVLGASAACGAQAASLAPATPPPTPVVTPDPHLAAPASADDVYRALNAAGLRISAINANAGDPGSPLIKRINATYLGWPLTIGQYQAVSDLDEEAPWPSGSAPGQGEPPISVVGLNILVQWGPTTGAEPAALDEIQMDALPVLVEHLNLLLSPLRGRTIVAVDAPGFTPAHAESAEPASAEPEATPAS